MGLCKCHRKKVTNQFCFEHRVNVCEYCMVEDHKQCIIQSYLRWLNDSDYNPVCQLCQQNLTTAECVRLVCYDVFHKTCLDEWASKLPANTAPAGYRCPICSSAIFPAGNLVSPVADFLKEFLSSCEWAKCGLGLTNVTPSVGSISYASSGQDTIGTHNKVSDRGIPDGRDTASSSTAFDPLIPPEDSHGTSQHRHLSIFASASGASPAERRSSESSSLYIDDGDADKYSRRPFADWLSRLIRTFQRPAVRHHQRLIKHKRGSRMLVALVVVVAIVLVLIFFSRRPDYDAMLDPLQNPNIHVSDD